MHTWILLDFFMNLLRTSLLATTLWFAPSIPEARGEEPSIATMAESQDFHDASIGVTEDDESSIREIRHAEKIQRKAARLWQENVEQANKPEFEKIRIEEAFFESYGIEVFKKLGLKELIWSEFMSEISKEKGLERISGMMPSRGRVFYLAKGWPLSHEIFHRIDYLMGFMPEDEGACRLWEGNNRQAAGRNNPQWYSLDHPSAVDPSRSDEDQAEYARMLMNLEDPRVFDHQYLPLMEYSGPRNKFALMRQWLFEFSDGWG